MRKILVLGVLCLLLTGCRGREDRLRELNTVQARGRLQAEPG